jgi:hypothetical protein
MAKRQPRYEYRVWAGTLEAVRDELQRLAELLGVQVSEETYLISATTESCNAKIRGGRMNIKTLLAIDRGLELWKPVMEAEFPLDASIITNQIFPRLELRASRCGRPRYSIDDFAGEIIRSHPRVATVTTLKQRTRFRLDECLAEFTTVTVGKRRYATVAVESIKPAPVLRLIQHLQIAAMPNISYIRRLKQVLDDGGNAD